MMQQQQHNKRKVIKSLLNNYFFQMIQTQECLSDPDEEPQQSHQINFICAEIQRNLAQLQFYVKIRSQTCLKAIKSSQITAKMRAKLLNWLQKLSLITFKFHPSTFITAVMVLDQYLGKSDETISNLQLVGCSALLIASKLREETVVSPDCYSSACCNIYSKKQLLLKQVQVYSQINWKQIKSGLLNAVQSGCKALKLVSRNQVSLRILSLLLKQEGFYGWESQKILRAVLALTKISEGESLSNQKILSLANSLA